MERNRLETESHSDEFDFSISYQERRWILMILDIVAINGGLLLSLLLRPDYDLSWALVLDNPIWFILLTGLWIFSGYLFQAYDLERVGKLDTTLVSVLAAGFVAVFIYNFIPYLPPALPPSRQPFFITILSPLIFLALVRGLYVLVFSRGTFRKNVLIVGAGWAGRTIYQSILEHGLSLYNPVGFVDDDQEKIGQFVEPGLKKGTGTSEMRSLEVLGSTPGLPALISEHQISTVVLAITRDTRGEVLQILTNSLQQGVEIIPMPVLYEQLTGKVPVEHVGDHWSVTMPLVHPGTKASRRFTKRLFDIVWASIGLLGLVVVFPFIALAIYLDSPGPILYRQVRLGRYGRKFQVYKFRSMIPDAEKGSAVWAERDDSRITRVGRILRRTHIDEFPQFINILLGDMSVVGPRPERPEFVEQLEEEIPFYRVRLAVKPGMAGWGLIHLGYGSSVEDMLEKLQYDLYYIKQQNFILDIYILAHTFMDAITFRGT